MSDSKQMIERFIQQERMLLQRLADIENEQTKATSEIGRIVTGELGGIFTGELFESDRAARHGRRIGRALAEDAQTRQVQSVKDAVESQHQLVLNSSRDYLSNMSERKPRLREPNSQALIDRIDRAQGYAKLRTRISKTILTLQNIAGKHLIPNTEIPRLLKEQLLSRSIHGEPYSILKELETNLRRCIQARLETASPDWWLSRIPPDVRQRAEERKDRNEKPWPWLEPRNLHPIHYIDFNDYAKIILRKDNWNVVFQPVFGDAELLSAKLRELEPIRNALAHSRELTKKEKSRLELLASDIFSSVEPSR